MMTRLSTGINQVLSSVNIEALNSIQIFSTIEFVNADSKLIESTTNLSFREIIQLKNDFIKKASPKPVNALIYYKHLIKNSAIIPSGIKSVDALLEGGFVTGKIYEISGLPASGKTLLGITIMRNVVINLKQKVYFLDTKQNFTGKKFKKLLNHDNHVDIMNKVLVKRLATKFELINSLFQIKGELESGLNVRMIIIDCMATLFMDTRDNAENNNILNHCANIMHYLTTELHVVLILTNLMTIWRESTDFESNDVFKKKISCGKFWQTIPNIQLRVEKQVNNKIKIFFLKSLRMPKIGEEAEVTISDKGIF